MSAFHCIQEKKNRLMIKNMVNTCVPKLGMRDWAFEAFLSDFNTDKPYWIESTISFRCYNWSQNINYDSNKYISNSSIFHCQTFDNHVVLKWKSSTNRRCYSNKGKTWKLLWSNHYLETGGGEWSSQRITDNFSKK